MYTKGVVDVQCSKQGLLLVRSILYKVIDQRIYILVKNTSEEFAGKYIYVVRPGKKTRIPDIILLNFVEF
jgi:hypothetical protein